MKNKFFCLKIYFIIITLSFLTMALLKIKFHRYLPDIYMLLISFPSMLIYIYNLSLFRKSLIKNGLIDESISKGSFPKTGLKLFIHFKIESLEKLRKRTLESFYIFFASIIFILIFLFLTN